MQILLEEKINLTANKDGGITSMEVKGNMMLRITDPQKSNCQFLLNLYQDPSIQYMVKYLISSPFHE